MACVCVAQTAVLNQQTWVVLFAALLQNRHFEHYKAKKAFRLHTGTHGERKGKKSWRKRGLFIFLLAPCSDIRTKVEGWRDTPICNFRSWWLQSIAYLSRDLNPKPHNDSWVLSRLSYALVGWKECFTITSFLVHTILLLEQEQQHKRVKEVAHYIPILAREEQNLICIQQC